MLDGPKVEKYPVVTRIGHKLLIRVDIKVESVNINYVEAGLKVTYDVQSKELKQEEEQNRLNM